jgi:hypothetical protein
MKFDRFDLDVWDKVGEERTVNTQREFLTEPPCALGSGTLQIG